MENTLVVSVNFAARMYSVVPAGGREVGSMAIPADGPETIEIDAARLEAWADPMKRAIDVAVAALDDPSLERRKLAVDMLAHAGPRAAYGLSIALQDGNREVRTKAADGLLSIGEAVPEVQDAILRAIASKNPQARYDAIHVMLRMQVRSPRCIEGLEQMLDDSDPSVRVAAAGTLYQATREPHRPLAILIAALQPSSGTDRVARDWAANFLGRMGEDAREALDALDEAARNDPADHVREAAVEAAARIRSGQ